MAASINASTTAGVVTTADTSGVLNIQTANTTAISISASQVVSYTNNPTYSGGTANGVLYLNGSKVATSGSALTFDGTNLGVNSSSTIDGGRFNVAFAGNTQNGICLKDTADASGASFWGAYNSTGGFIGSLRRSGTDNALAINGNSYLAFQQNSTEQMRLTSTGLGIGTSSPTSGAKLDVNGQIVAQNGSTSSLGYAFRLALSSGMYLYDDGVGANVILQANANNNQLYLQRTGNVGIGTSSPSYKLDVNTTGGASATARLYGNDQANVRLRLQNAGAGGNTWEIVGGAPGANNSDFAIYDATGAATRLLLTSSGNLGLGVTPSAWGSNFKAQQIGNYGAYIAGRADSINQIWVGTNSYFNGTNWIYTNSLVAATYAQSNGAHLWFNAPSGTAGNAITFTQAMTLDVSGNLGIGTTSPTARLTVSTNTSNEGEIRISDNATYYAGLRRVNATDEFRIGSYGASQNITFYTVSSERARIDSSGNLLVGTTSTTVWNGSAGTKVVVGGSGNTITSLQSSTTTVDQGAIFEGYATGISSNSAALGSIAFLRSNTSTTALSSYTAFYTNNAGTVAERARIDSNGTLMIGTTNPNASIGPAVGGFVNYCSSTGTNSAGFVSTTTGTPYGAFIWFNNLSPNNTGSYFLLMQDSTAVRARFYANGGLANYQANDVNLSDRRDKTNFAPAGEYLSKICAIPVQTFNYIDQNLEEDAGLTLGVVAQDVQAVAPELVMESNWGTEENPKMRLSIYQTDLQYALMKCIQEQQAIIEQLKADVAALKGNT